MSETNYYSPDGRLHQVDFAMKAVAQGDLCLGIVADDGVLLAVDCRSKNLLIDNSDRWDKFFPLTKEILCVASGIMSDANVVIDELRERAEVFENEYQLGIPCDQLVTYAAQVKHVYTVQAGKRPFGVSMLYIGYSESLNCYQLFHTDPAGNYIGWRATAIGNKSENAQSLLRKELNTMNELTLKDAQILVIKVLSKTLGISKLNADMFKIATIKKVRGKNVQSVLGRNDLEGLIRKYKQLQIEEEESLRMNFSDSAAESNQLLF